MMRHRCHERRLLEIAAPKREDVPGRLLEAGEAQVYLNHEAGIGNLRDENWWVRRAEQDATHQGGNFLTPRQGAAVRSAKEDKVEVRRLRNKQRLARKTQNKAS